MNLNKHGSWIQSIIAGALCLGAGEALAQHYPAGAEGIRAATLPPPGVYLRDYNIGFYAPNVNAGPVDIDIVGYRNAPRVIWMTDQKIFGADYGMDVIVPFGYSEVRAPGQISRKFGLGDIQIEPLLLAWHPEKFDIAAGYAIWAPTGEFDPNHLSIGQGYWTHMLTGGGTWNIDEEKSMAVSVLGRYEISHEQQDTHRTPGQMLTIEAGVSKVIAKGVEVGAVGYWQQQTTESTGANSLGHIGAAGPEVTFVIPKVEVAASLRYLRQFAAKDAIEGNLFVLTLTKRL